MGAALLVLITLGVGIGLHFQRRANEAVLRELREDPMGERAQKVMEIALPSGKTMPVNYLRVEPGDPDGDPDGVVFYAGADFPWWRALRGDGLPVRLFVAGESLAGHARAIEDDPEHRRAVFSRLRPRAIPWAGTLVEIKVD